LEKSAAANQPVFDVIHEGFFGNAACFAGCTARQEFSRVTAITGA
jgi:hypothetical protein